MKQFNLPKVSPRTGQWVLVGSLVASLGASMSFNPESKTVARHNFETSGEMVLAQKAPTPPVRGGGPVPPEADKPVVSEPTPKPADKAADAKVAPIKVAIDDYTEVVGYRDEQDGKLLWNIQKKADAKDGAKYCIDCVTKTPIQVIDLKNTGLTDLAAIEFFVKAKAQEQIAKLGDKKEEETDKREVKDSKVSSAARVFDLKSDCRVKDYTSGSRDDASFEVEYEDLFACQSDELEDSIAECQKKEDQELAAKKPTEESNSRRRHTSRRDDRDDDAKYKVCERGAIKYAHKNIEPLIKNALSSMDNHEAGIAAIGDFFGADGILGDMAGAGSIRTEIARSLVQADAGATLQFLSSEQLNSNLYATGTCQAMYIVNDRKSYNECMQNAKVLATRNAFVDVTNRDYAMLSRTHSLDRVSLSVFSMAATNAQNQLMSATAKPTDFAAVLQSMSMGSTQVGPVSGNGQVPDPSGRISGRWAPGSPDFPGVQPVNPAVPGNPAGPNNRTMPQNGPVMQQPPHVFTSGAQGGNVFRVN